MPQYRPAITPPEAWCGSVVDVPSWQVADVVLARSLFTTWAIRTGRALRPLPLTELTAEELADFWADDQLEPLHDSSCSQLP
jgi:hypothetical protein